MKIPFFEGGNRAWNFRAKRFRIKYTVQSNKNLVSDIIHAVGPDRQSRMNEPVTAEDAAKLREAYRSCLEIVQSMEDIKSVVRK